MKKYSIKSYKGIEHDCHTVFIVRNHIWSYDNEKL